MKAQRLSQEIPKYLLYLSLVFSKIVFFEGNKHFFVFLFAKLKSKGEIKLIMIYYI